MKSSASYAAATAALAVTVAAQYPSCIVSVASCLLPDIAERIVLTFGRTAVFPPLTPRPSSAANAQIQLRSTTSTLVSPALHAALLTRQVGLLVHLRAASL